MVVQVLRGCEDKEDDVEDDVLPDNQGRPQTFEKQLQMRRRSVCFNQATHAHCYEENLSQGKEDEGKKHHSKKKNKNPNQNQKKTKKPTQHNTKTEQV